MPYCHYQVKDISDNHPHPGTMVGGILLLSMTQNALNGGGLEVNLALIIFQSYNILLKIVMKENASMPTYYTLLHYLTMLHTMHGKNLTLTTCSML